MYDFNQANHNRIKPEMFPRLPEVSEFGYGQILGIIWRRRYWFLVTFLAVFSVGGLLSLQKEPTYESYLQILVEPNYQVNPEEGEFSAFTENSVEMDYSTQLNLMRSSGLLQQAVERLRGDYPDLTIGDLRSQLSLERVTEGDVETKLFQANYVSNDPLKTQRILSAILGVYQEYNLEQQNQRLTEGLSFTREQIAIARDQLAEMEANLREFRTEHNLISPETNAQGLTERLEAVQQQRGQVRSTYQGTLAQFNALQTQLGRSSSQGINAARLSESRLYQGLSEQLQENEITLIQERTRFTDASPTVQALLQERRELLALREREQANLLPSRTDAQVNTINAQAGQLGSTELDLVGNLVATQAELANLAGQEQSLAQLESQLRTDLNRFPALLAQYNRLQQELEVQRATLQQLLEAQQELGIEINRGGFNWQVVEPPLVGQQIAPNRQQDLLLAGVVALFVGGIVVYGREMLDSGIHSSEQLQQHTPLPVLGVVPKAKAVAKVGKVGVFSNLSPHSPGNNTMPSLTLFQWQPFRESLDLIYKHIQLLSGQLPPKSLTVTSALIGEGKSTVAMGLALSASRSNQRVLIIDGNLRQPSLHSLLEVPNEKGLTDFLKGAVDSPPIQTLTVVNSQLEVLTAGLPVDDPVQLLSSRRLAEWLKTVEQTYDLVIVDTPAVLGVADTIHLASATQAVVLVGGLEQINQGELQQATAILGQLNLIGIIANGTKDAGSGGYATTGLAPHPSALAASALTNGHKKPVSL
jgi:succinoglycan biosynthesis transport protein ExoP